MSIAIGASAEDNPTRRMHYKSANTDVIAWICERIGGRSQREHFIELVEGFGAADTVYLSTARSGTPFVGGGLHMTLPDLARYGLLLGRAGYRNFLETEGTWIGHNGYGGQWLLVYPDSEIVMACLSGLSEDGGLDCGFIRRLAAPGSELAGALEPA